MSKTMIRLEKRNVFLQTDQSVRPVEDAGNRALDLLREEGRKKTIAYKILNAHSAGAEPGMLHLKFDSLVSPDNNYVSILQTFRAGKIEEFPVPYVLSNCHHTLCAVGGTINEDDHVFGLGCAEKYGGIFLPPYCGILHQYMRETMAGCVKGTFGDEVEAVAYSEGSQLNADVIGGHVALACVGPADVSAMIESGDMKPVLTCTEQRLTIDAYSDTQCTGELGIDCYYGPYRFIAYKEGTPEAACEALLTAAEKASADEDFQKWVREEGLDQRQIWKGREELKAQWDSDKAEFEEIFGQ